MEKAYVVVFGLIKGDKTWMKFLGNREQVLSTISCLKDEHEVVRIFEVDEFGITRMMDVVFDGRLNLVYKTDEFAVCESEYADPL